MRRTFRVLSLPSAAVVAFIASGIVSAMGLPPTPPFTRPFAADKQGTVFDTDVRIKEYRNYWFMLVIKAKDAQTLGKAEGLIAQNYVDANGRVRQRDPGVLHLQIWEKTGTVERLLVEKICSGYEGGGYGEHFVDLRFTSLKLHPGLYRVRVESSRGIDGIAQLPVQINFAIGYHPNSTPITE